MTPIAKHFIVKVTGSPDAHWYRCKKCGKITQFNLGHCPSVRCEGKLVEIEEDDNVDGLLVIDTADVLMICRKGCEGDVRRFLNDAKMKIGEKFA